MTVPAATPHQAFSFARIWAIATNTLLELFRMKIFFFVLIFGILVIGSSWFTSQMTFQEIFQSLKAVSLGAMSVFTWLLSVLATAMLLPKDIEDRTLYTILAKPVPRFEYLLGKLLGVLALLAVAVLLMSVFFTLVLSIAEMKAIAEAPRVNSPEHVAEAIQQIRDTTFTYSLLACVVMIYLKVALCAAFTLLISTFASSTIFTVMVSIAVYLISYIQPLAREYALTTAGPLTKAFLGGIALLFPDISSIDLVDDTVAGNLISLSLFLKSAGVGITYTIVYFFAGFFMFSKKEL